jgi:hypothetical protein
MENQKIQPGTTLREIKEYLKSNYKVGCKCPACNQNVKLHPRKLNSSMAFGLVILYKLQRIGGVKMNEEIAKLKIPSSNIEYAKLAYWKLAEEVQGLKGKRSGHWKITKLGIDFVRGDKTVSKTAYVYNNNCYGLSPDQVTLDKAFGTKFKYHDLLKSI